MKKFTTITIPMTDGVTNVRILEGILDGAR